MAGERALEAKRKTRSLVLTAKPKTLMTGWTKQKLWVKTASRVGGGLGFCIPVYWRKNTIEGGGVGFFS